MRFRDQARAFVLPTVVAAGVLCAPATAQVPGDAGFVRNELPAETTTVGPQGPLIQYRIVGGLPAAYGAWSSMVALFARQESGTSMCGGTLIDREWVLTAAHCVTNGRTGQLHSPAALLVREGTNILSAGAGNAIEVREIVRHPQYRTGPTRNDIALIRLAQPARSPGQLLIANRARSSLLRPGVVGTVTGFGLVRPQPATRPENHQAGPTSNQLLQVSLPIIALDRCAAVYSSEPGAISEAVFCAGVQEGGRDACMGDSGGPLYVRGPGGQTIQAGIVSFGRGCALPNTFGVYASVGYFESWIRQHVPTARFHGEEPPMAGAPAARPPGVAAVDQSVAAAGDVPDNGRPGMLAQVSCDVGPSRRPRIGEALTITATSSADGILAVFNQNAAGQTVQVFPNVYFRQPRAVTGGQPVALPGPADGIQLTLGPPTGLNRITAFVLPPTPRIVALLERHAGDGRQVIANPEEFFAELTAQLTQRDLTVAPQANRAAAQCWYEIVN